ncbi:MAG: phosphoribosylglycinamide formyltransferase [Bacilli bacterium]
MTRRIAVFASGSGSNFEAIANYAANGKLNADVVLLVTDNPDAYAIQRAQQFGIPTFAFSPRAYPSKAAFESAVLEQLQAHDVHCLVLAGYMRLVGSVLLGAYPNRILNIHPSLLPAFPGLDAVGQAYRAGVHETGVTVHVVDEGMDTGPAVAQKACPITPEMTLEQLTANIHAIEHALYPPTIAAWVQANLESKEGK